MLSLSHLFFIIALGVGKFILGWLWYGSIFGKQWKEAMRASRKEGPKNVQTPLLLNFVASITTSFIMCYLIDAIGITTWLGGALLGFLCWSGFVLATQIDIVLFEKQHPILFGLNISFQLVSLLLLGALYGIWY